MSNENLLKTGTTTVGILLKDAVILAADKRATAGNLIVGKNVRKVVPINDSMAVTTAGSVSDIQLLVKILRSEMKLKEVRSNRKVTVKEAATFLSGMVYGNLRTTAGVSHFLFGGFDKKPHLYDIYPDGSIIDISEEEGIMASGSGSVFAFGVLEDLYRKDMSHKEAVDLANRAIHSALKRDSASGQGISIYLITKDGCEEVSNKKISEKLE